MQKDGYSRADLLPPRFAASFQGRTNANLWQGTLPSGEMLCGGLLPVYGRVGAGGTVIRAWSALYGVSGTVISPRVGRSRSKVTSSSIVTRTVAKIIGHTPRPSTDR